MPPADASEADLAELQAQAWAAASLSVAGIRVQGIKGRVEGYGVCSFRVEFTPRVAGACVHCGRGLSQTIRCCMEVVACTGPAAMSAERQLFFPLEHNIQRALLPDQARQA